MLVPRTEVPRAQRNGEGKLFETVFVERIVSSSLGAHPLVLSRSNLVGGRQGMRTAPCRWLCNPAGVWTHHVLGALFYDTPVRRQEEKTGRLPLNPLETERWG